MTSRLPGGHSHDRDEPPIRAMSDSRAQHGASPVVASRTTHSFLKPIAIQTCIIQLWSELTARVLLSYPEPPSQYEADRLVWEVCRQTYKIYK